MKPWHLDIQLGLFVLHVAIYFGLVAGYLGQGKHTLMQALMIVVATCCIIASFVQQLVLKQAYDWLRVKYRMKVGEEP